MRIIGKAEKYYQEGKEYVKEQQKKNSYITSGSRELDQLFDGAIPSGKLIELVGESRSGKTQICLTCAATVQLPFEEGGVSGKVLYIDTDNSFNLHHYLRIGNRFGLEKDELLENLVYVEAERVMILEEVIDLLPEAIKKFGIKIIIIDSIVAPYEREYSQMNQYPWIQKTLYGFLGRVKALAIKEQLFAIYTNQVRDNFAQNSCFMPYLPYGGTFLAHIPDIQVSLKKLKGNMRRAKIEACAWLPVETADFYLTKVGIYDDEEYHELPKEEPIKEKKKVSRLLEGLEEIEEQYLKKKKVRIG